MENALSLIVEISIILTDTLVYSIPCVTNHPFYLISDLLTLWITCLLTYGLIQSVGYSILCVLSYLFTHSHFCPCLVINLLVSFVQSLIHSIHSHADSSISFKSVTYRKYHQSFACSLSHSVEHLLACLHAERSPLVCWECDSWIPWTSRLPQQHDCMKQWMRNSNMMAHLWPREAAHRENKQKMPHPRHPWVLTCTL